MILSVPTPGARAPLAALALLLSFGFSMHAAAVAQGGERARERTTTTAATTRTATTGADNNRAQGSQQGSQNPPANNRNPPAEKPSAEDADLSITARVTAREVLFRKVPNPTVEFTGKPERNTLWESDRENLPEQVQPGVTYRNVGITLRIVSVFADIDRIVAEALGEVPASDDDPAPSPAAPPGAQQQPGAPAVAPAQSAPPRPEVSASRVSTAARTSPEQTSPETSARATRRAGRGARRGTQP